MFSQSTANMGNDVRAGRGNPAYVALICLVAAMGGLLFGYDWVVIGGAAPFYEAYFELDDPVKIGWAMSAALLGCLAGSVLSGGLADRFGRKRLLLLTAVLFAVSSIFTGLAENFSMFVLWRLAGGVAIGMASNLSPMYIAEVSPAVWRGRLVALNQLTIVMGILLAQGVNWLIALPVSPQLEKQAQEEVARKNDYEIAMLMVGRYKAQKLGNELQKTTNTVERVELAKKILAEPGVVTVGDKVFTNKYWVMDERGGAIAVEPVPELSGEGLGRKINGGQTLAGCLVAAATNGGVVCLSIAPEKNGVGQPQLRQATAVPIPNAEGYYLGISQPQDSEQVKKERRNLLRQTENGQRRWRWMFMAVAIPSLLFFISGFFVPESPRWLVRSGMAERARLILAKIGGESHAQEELAAIQETLAAQAGQDVRMADLFAPRMLKILIIGCVLAVLQQWSGINVLFNYAAEIFQQAGYGVSDSLLFIVITGAVNLVFTLVAMGLVDRFGRRKLMLLGCAGICLSHVLMGAAYSFPSQGLLVLIFALLAIGCYAMTLAPVTWVLISEIFPNRLRGTAISVAVSSLWIACFILTFTFPMLSRSLGAAKTFWVYAAICAAGFVFVLQKVPETKGKSLEQIEKELVG